MQIHWPYHFVSTTREAATRRALLDSTGSVTAVVSLAFVALSFSYVFATRKDRRSKSNESAANQLSSRNWNTWPLTGQKEAQGPVFLIALWASAMIYMVQWNTSDDYLHITRSPAQVASALLMANVALSLPPIRNQAPQIIAFHRLQSLVIFGLLISHAMLYINFYAQNNLLMKRIQMLDVQLGIGMVILSMALWYSGARIQALRSRLGVIEARWLHVGLTLVLGIMLWFHSQHARANISRAAVVWAGGQLWRIGQSRGQAKRE